MAARLIVPAHPPPPTISKRLFQFAGSFTANFASGQMTPRTSQCSGRLAAAATLLANSIFTSDPNEIEASSSHFFAGAAKMQAGIKRDANAAVFIVLYLITHSERKKPHKLGETQRMARGSAGLENSYRRKLHVSIGLCVNNCRVSRKRSGSSTTGPQGSNAQQS